MTDKFTQTSKFLSYLLRHNPGEIGLVLDSQGWADVNELIDKAAAQGHLLTQDLIETIVATSDKKRFVLSVDGAKIRANQGHSIEVDLALQPLSPPEKLFHGTATRFLDSIHQQGLIKGSRQHVHLSADEETAQKVGQRHGKPVILTIRSRAMESAGHHFFRSENGVWLTEHVPSEFIEFP